MKHLLSLLLLASPVLAEPVCEKWVYKCIKFRYLGGESPCEESESICTKWHETPTPAATAVSRYCQPLPTMRSPLDAAVQLDFQGNLIISKKSDAEALKALGLKMCEGR